MTRFGYTLTILLGASLGAAACSDPIEDNTQPPDQTNPGDTSSGDPDTTFDHENGGISVWDLIDRLTKEGPPSFSSQMHGCTKMRYATLGNVLTAVGINKTNTANLSAGQLYSSGGPALGVANYGARVRENLAITTSAASREFDILASGATEVITAIPTLERCKVGGVAAQIFDANNQCVASGIECIIGVPATQGHLEFCNLTIARASTPDIGKRIAVAAMMAAAYTCE
jgi:hypothetical protein